jgi:hypothetical protein
MQSKNPVTQESDGKAARLPILLCGPRGELWVRREKNAGALTPKYSQFLICPLNQSK